MSAHWSLGVLIGLPVLTVITLALAALATWALIRWHRAPRDYYGEARFGYGMIGFFALGLTLIFAGGMAIGYFPYGSTWHKYVPVQGTVQAVGHRLIGDGDGGMNQRFVVRFTNGVVRSCDDTRCALLKPGDHLALSCIRSWQYAATPGWNCNFEGAREVAR